MLFLAILAFSVDPTITLPQEISGQPGEFITIKPATNGKVVRFVAIDTGINLFPSDLLSDKTVTVASCTQPGRYRVLAYTALGDVASPPAITTVVIGGVAPPSPVNPVNPPQPTDPMAEALQSIYGALAEDGKEAKRAALAGVYKRAVEVAGDSRLKTTGEMYLVVRQMARQVLADGDLRGIRDRLNQELDGILPTVSETPLTPELREKIKGQFSRCAAALEGLK